MQDAIFIAAPAGTGWPLRYEDFEARLAARYPEVRSFPKHAPVSGKDYLDFEVALDGEVRHGSYFDRSYLILRDGPPELWADTIAWFLGLLPKGTPAVAMVETNPDTVPLPADAGPEEIQTLIDTLVTAG